MFGLTENSALNVFEAAERAQPSLCKRSGRRVVYRSRPLGLVSVFAPAVLGDLGSACDGRVPQTGIAQPQQYRAPEVILGVPWGYGVDIWSVGVMVSQPKSDSRVKRQSSRPKKQN